MLRTSFFFRQASVLPSSSASSSPSASRLASPVEKKLASSLARTLYRRILKELRATQKFEHHLRDLRFLLWAPGTRGKRQEFDALKLLAKREGQSLLSPRSNTDRASSSLVASSANSNNNTNNTAVENTASSSSTNNNFKPTIADQLRAVARGLFDHKSDFSVSNPLKARQEGTARAFWAVKRLQDIRAGLVPTASIWLVSSGIPAHQKKIIMRGAGGILGSSSSSSSNLLTASGGTTTSATSSSSSARATSSSSSSATALVASEAQHDTFDPFSTPKDAQFRSGAFPFLPEFLGVDRETSFKSALENSAEEGTDTANSQVIEDAVAKLANSFGRCSNSHLKLEVVARCACKEGNSARYHISFRMENVSDSVLSVKLAHLFAVRCESPPVLTEMVSQLPLFGNSLLSPDALRLSGEEAEIVVAEGETSTTTSDSSQQQQQQTEESNSGENEEGWAAKLFANRKSSPQQQQQKSATTTSSLPPETGLKSENLNSPPSFTAKPQATPHCGVYDISFPLQGECILRGIVHYRVITNSLPTVDKNENSSSSQEGGGANNNNNNNNSPPSGVKSRLFSLNFGPIRLWPSS